MKETSSGDQQVSLTPRRSSLQLGNSDPFDTQAIPIGPRESDLLKVYREFTVQSSGKASWWKVNRVEVVQATCLSDEAAAYALLARNSAMPDVKFIGHNIARSTTHLSYLTRAQAALRKNLSLMTGSEMSSVIRPAMWTTFFLAYAELITGSPTLGVHIRAMSQLVIRYAALMGDKVNKADIIAVAIVDFMAACTTLSRQTIDMVNWFPGIFQAMWDKTGVRRNERGDDKATLGNIHRYVKDKRLRTIILDQREEQEKRHELLEGDPEPAEAEDHGHAVHSRQLFLQAQLLHIALDAMERLGAPRVNDEQVQDQAARAYMSLSVLLWLLTTSPISFATERLLDGTGKILQHTRSMLVKGATAFPSSRRSREARLWALCIGVHTEVYRKVNLGSGLACREWFFEAFNAEVKALQIHSWKQVAGISEKLLSLDRTKPHISEWWHQVVVDHNLEG